jgi:hypothetical protein
MGLKINTEFWWAHLLEDQEGNGRITLREILGIQVMRIRAGWNWFRIMSKGRL